MIVVNAEELFYSRVEAAYSPEGSAGYQVVYHTPGLAKTEISAIESAVKCFEAANVSSRYQYFNVGSRVAMAVSREIAEVDRSITDRSGRSGAFVSHCLLLDRAVFAELGNNPFILFEQEDYFSLEPQAMIEAQAANKPQRILEVEPLTDTAEYAEFNFEITDWTAPEFIKLWALAAQANGIVSARQSVQMISQDEQLIYDTLYLLLRLAPPALRPHCTFNSYVDGCVPMPGTYWALGGERRINNALIVQARLDDQKIMERAGSSFDPVLRQAALDAFQGLRQVHGLIE